MAFGKKNNNKYTTKTTTTYSDGRKRAGLPRWFWILAVLLLLQTIILLILAATAGKHNIWPFNRIWLAEAQMNMERQASVLSVGSKFSDLVSTVLPASFPNIAIPIYKLLVSHNSMKLFASKDSNVLANSGVPQNQWDNVQDMFVKFNKDESYMIYPTKDSQGVDIGPFKENVLNYKVVGHRVRSYFTSFKWMFHINWIICVFIIALLWLAQKKRDNNVGQCCLFNTLALILIFMVFFFNLVMYIVMHFGVQGIASFLNRITIGAIPQSISDFLGARQQNLNEQMFYAKSSSMRKLVLAILILLFITFILVLLEVIFMFLSLPKILPGTTRTTTTTTTKRVNRQKEHEIDIADDRYHYRTEN